MKLLIRQGRLVDPVGGIGGIMDVLVEDGKVAVIGSNINEPDARVIDARGLTVCAGLVDMHVHLREPGFEYKETIETGAARPMGLYLHCLYAQHPPGHRQPGADCICKAEGGGGLRRPCLAHRGGDPGTAGAGAHRL